MNADSTPDQRDERRKPHGGQPIRVGLLGCGVVGGGVLRLLAANSAAFAERVGVPIEVHRVLVRDPAKVRVGELDPVKLTTVEADLLADASIDIIVEVMGGEEEAGRMVEHALARGVSVVSANKALLAARGQHLLDLAIEHRADLAFEAAVGGGIPVVRTLRDAFASDEVTEIVGILNGTSNYILSAMADEGKAFDLALAEAQAAGYAEADPTLDVGGFDAAHKLIVLAMLAFGARPPHQGMLIDGIDQLAARDVQIGVRLGYTVKHLVIGRDHGDSVELRAHPTFVPKSSMLGNVSGVLNAVSLHGRALGPCFLSGRGAGDMPTAVSVVADILDVARSIVAGVPGLLTAGRGLKTRPLLPQSEVRTRHYLRLDVRDEPGVMAGITRALADASVSLSRIEQEEATGGTAEVVLVTHTARQGAVDAALSSMKQQNVLLSQPVHLRIEDALR